MFREIVKDVYIGKSQLGIWVNGKRVPKETLVKDIALPTLLGNKLPDYGTIGNFTQWEFEVNPGGNHKLFITGIPKKTYVPLPYLRFRKSAASAKNFFFCSNFSWS